MIRISIRRRSLHEEGGGEETSPFQARSGSLRLGDPKKNQLLMPTSGRRLFCVILRVKHGQNRVQIGYFNEVGGGCQRNWRKNGDWVAAGAVCRWGCAGGEPLGPRRGFSPVDLTAWKPSTGGTPVPQKTAPLVAGLLGSF